MLIARFAGAEAGDRRRHTQQALRYMEEPTMLAEAITEWRQNAIAEGRTEGIRQGRSEGMREGRSEGMREGTSEGRRSLLQRQATRRYGVEAGDEFGRLLAGEADADRLALAGDLVIDCSSHAHRLRTARQGVTSDTSRIEPATLVSDLRGPPSPRPNRRRAARRCGRGRDVQPKHLAGPSPVPRPRQESRC